MNAPPPPNYRARPDPNLGQERQIQSEGYQKSDALEIGFRGRPVDFFTGQVGYNVGKTYNNTSGITYFPANSYLPKADWSGSDNDQRHRFDLLGAFGAGKWFTFGTGLSAYSGKPVNVTTGNDDFNNGMSNARPTGVSRNSFHGPGYLSLDLNLAHDVLLTKAGNKGPLATISINSFNVLNHTNDVTSLHCPGLWVLRMEKARRQGQTTLWFRPHRRSHDGIRRAVGRMEESCRRKLAAILHHRYD